MKSCIKEKRGLTRAEADLSRQKNGSNTLSEKKSKSFIHSFFENLGDPVIKILLVALAVNLFMVFRGGDVIETLGIGASVFLATLISTLSERGSEAAFKRLNEACSHSLFRVRRDGALCKLPIDDIVVGDIVMISAGEQIPADAFVISGELSVDQSMITGESREVRKASSIDTTKTPSSQSAVFRGCTVLSGDGEIEIFSVGENSFLGKISDEVSTDTRESPMKLRLSRLAGQISIFSYIAAILIGLAYLFNTLIIDSGFESVIIMRKINDLHYLFEQLLHAFMLALTVIVMAVPEGLPMMIAVVLSSNTRRMIKDNVLVRKSTGIEAAGSMNILFCDKTGTLTEGKMSLSQIITPDGSSYDAPSKMSNRSWSYQSFLLNTVLNSSCSFCNREVFGGNSTEKALARAVLNEDIREIENGYKREKRIPFSSDIKFSAAAVSGKSRLFLVKGAPEKLLPNVKYAYTHTGRSVSFSTVSYDFLRINAQISAEGGRVIWMAESDRMPSEKELGTLTLVCAVVLSDKLREEARSSTEELKRAGVRVVMITGDNRDTATSIARQCGILSSSNDVILTAEELSRLDDNELKALLPRLSVLARALPSDKSRLVRAAQDLGMVVGMTGDGVNDAPALKRADIGFAMGSGTEVAKEAGDIIILDNDLSSISKAVLYGRTIFKSIRKFITLQLTMNFCAVGISMIGPFIGYDSPVTVVQMLWINMIMDTLGGLAFAGEAPLSSYMLEKPKRRDEPILNRYIINQIAVSSILTVGIYIFFLLSPRINALFRHAPDKIYLLTGFFALFIFTSVLHCFNCRTDRMRIFSGLSKNKAFIAIIFTVCAVQIAFIYLGGAVLRTTPLSLHELGITLALSLCVIPIELIRKALLKLTNKKTGF